MEIKVTIVGVTPLLINKFTDAAAQNATDGVRGGGNGERLSPREDAESRLYKDEKGAPIIPGTVLFRCIIDGGAYFKSGKKQVTTQKSSMVPACLAINELYIPIEHKEPWTVDTRPVRIPATGGRILRHRPTFNDWKLSFTLDLDTELMSAKLTRDIVDAAGKRVGMCDFRPSCKGPFGRFRVDSWKEVR